MGVEPSLPVDAKVEVRPWWGSPLCLALVVLATTVPLLYPPVPPLVDLFGHMGRSRVAKARWPITTKIRYEHPESSLD